MSKLESNLDNLKREINKTDYEKAYMNGVLKTTIGSFLDDNTDIKGRQK